MNQPLLLSLLISLSLSGCLIGEESSHTHSNEAIIPTPDPDTGNPTPPPEPNPDPDTGNPTPPPPPEPQTFIASLLSSGKTVTGDVFCDGKKLTNGTFKIDESTSFSCQFGSIQLADLVAPDVKVPDPENRTNELTTSFDLTETEGKNVTPVLQSISTCPSRVEEICLEEINNFDIEEIYKHLDDNKAVEAFLKPKDEALTDVVDKAPSSHVDSAIAPSVTEGTSNDLNGSFVSAAAEESLQYKPSAESQVLTQARLIDTKGKPIEGIQFFSANSNGQTNQNGEFEYLWGDEIIFGIASFEFGRVRGNQIEYLLTDVTENEIKKNNIQALLNRYALIENNTIIIEQKVHDVFNDFPNVINEIINLSLPNGGKLADTEFSLPNEFEKQFESGLAKVVDQNLKKSGRMSDDEPVVYTSNSQGYVSETLRSLFNRVNAFHVFHDSQSYYGASGFTRGMRALNLSNRAFPIMMPRKDLNREIPLKEAQAWTREGKPHLAWHPEFTMPPVPFVSNESMIFDFPFVTAGQIGKGKVVFMGNSLYPSILSCPDNYWAEGAVTVDTNNNNCTTKDDLSDSKSNDQGSMKNFFSNVFQWFAPEMNTGSIAVGTNIDTSYISIRNWPIGSQYKFFIHSDYGFSQVQHFKKGSFTGISAKETPILILQAYPIRVDGAWATKGVVSDLEHPNLSVEDVTALIQYLHEGGNILFMDAILEKTNPEPIGRLTDAAGMSVGAVNVTPLNQANCGANVMCGEITPNIHVRGEDDMVVLERFPDESGKPVYQVQLGADGFGEVTWNPPESMTSFEIPKYDYQVLDQNGQAVTKQKYARIFVKTPEEKAAAIQELQQAFEGTPLCQDEYEYEFNCIEFRKGHGFRIDHTYGRKTFERYPVSPELVDSMIKAANLGSNIQSLYDHEIYFRTKGKQGIRLPSNELNRAYDNLSVWLWNDNPYKYDPNVQDELGFKTFVEFLNCYTNDQHGQGQLCSAERKAALVQHQMIHGEGELAHQLNPSYPLNYMEKPLTRLMLGRSFWDHDITVDTTAYPGHSTGPATSASVDIITEGQAVTFSAGNNQSTGLWAPQLKNVTVTGGVPASITVMMADDLTGLPKHEKSLMRPPRMQMVFAHDGTSTTFKVPYGGLISIQPDQVAPGTSQFSFSGVEIAPWWKNGEWIHSPAESSAPIAEIDTGAFIYTTAVNQVKNEDIGTFSHEMNFFADAASDFYGRDETNAEGKHRRFTYPALQAYRHRYTNDVQISIGAAHSGYPVMSSAFDAKSTKIPTKALDDWLIWHEVGHNLAAAPFMVSGATEVTNNILALYMQELRQDKPYMERIETTLKKVPLWLKANSGHAWSHGDAGYRLAMFGQLKIWAETEFDLSRWYAANETKPNIYNDDQGWNLFKLIHRKARGDQQGDQSRNYCSASETGLNASDLLMVCTSYVSGYDLGEFFTKWNVGESSSESPDGVKSYSGGITNQGLTLLSSLDLPQPKRDPLAINQLPLNH